MKGRQERPDCTTVAWLWQLGETVQLWLLQFGYTCEQQQFDVSEALLLLLLLLEQMLELLLHHLLGKLLELLQRHCNWNCCWSLAAVPNHSGKHPIYQLVHWSQSMEELSGYHYSAEGL